MTDAWPIFNKPKFRNENHAFHKEGRYQIEWGKALYSTDSHRSRKANGKSFALIHWLFHGHRRIGVRRSLNFTHNLTHLLGKSQIGLNAAACFISASKRFDGLRFNAAGPVSFITRAVSSAAVA
jgi:hypothetical protein